MAPRGAQESQASVRGRRSATFRGFLDLFVTEVSCALADSFPVGVLHLEGPSLEAQLLGGSLGQGIRGHSPRTGSLGSMCPVDHAAKSSRTKDR